MTPQDTYHVLDLIMGSCDGIVIDSELDRWPLKQNEAAAAAAGQGTG
jgi:hypothetical protein